MILTVKTTENLFKMIASEDEDNKYIALKSVDEIDINKSLGFIMLLYKFSGISSSLWKLECPKIWKKFHSISLIGETKDLPGFNDPSPTASKILRTMIAQHCELESITMFLQLHNRSLLDVLKAWGYDLSDLEVHIKLKEKEHAEQS